MTGETHFERWTTDTTLKEISSWSLKAQDPKDRTKSPEIGYPYEYPYPIPKTKKIMHWESEGIYKKKFVKLIYSYLGIFNFHKNFVEYRN